jgi:hypothetical protein
MQTNLLYWWAVASDKHSTCIQPSTKAGATFACVFSFCKLALPPHSSCCGGHLVPALYGPCCCALNLPKGAARWQCHPCSTGERVQDVCILSSTGSV